MTTFENHGNGKIKANQVAIDKAGVIKIYSFKNRESAKKFINDIDTLLNCSISSINNDVMFMQDSNQKEVVIYWK